jgi:hypothetical protein
METIQPFPKPLWWSPTIQIDIANNKKEAKRIHDEISKRFSWPVEMRGEIHIVEVYHD